MKFVDLDHEAELSQASRLAKLGIILFSEDERWFAFRPSTGYYSEGLGAPQKLEHGIWVIDKEYEDAKVIGQRLSGVSMRSSSWLKLSIAKIRKTWGVERQPEAASVKLVAQVADRILGLSQEAVLRNFGDLRLKNTSEAVSHFNRAASLATGIYTVSQEMMKRSGSTDKRVTEHFTKAWQQGMYIFGRKEAEEDHINLTFSFPKLSYALAVTSGKVPGPGVWQMAGREDHESADDFCQKIASLNRPALFRARCKPAGSFVPEHATAFANPPNQTVDSHRTRFTIEEIRELSKDFEMSIESVICGTEWIEPGTGKMLRSLEEAAGGPEAARASWSVGIAAENILASAFRKERSEVHGQYAEAVWIAARDRAAMMPAIRALYDVGASLVSAYLGTITVKCPMDLELLVTILGTAWEQGLVLPVEEVELLNEMGVVAPVEPSLFGGNDVDCQISTIAHSRKRKTLWALDSIQDHKSEDRERMFRKLMS